MTASIPVSILDLAPVPEGGTIAGALAASADLARHGEALGYHRFWLAEHHNMPGVASAATAVVIGHVAAATRRIRVGSGGIMLPNHAPLMVAEAFGTLAELFPGRIDLGVGRAPGTDGATAAALRRTLAGGDRFPQDVVELLGYLGAPDPARPVQAVPGSGTNVPVWILGSSLFGAELAAYLGLPYAFASHFAPAALDEAVDLYRERFRPSAWLAAPRFMLAAGLYAAETDHAAELLLSSMIQTYANLRLGRPQRLPRPVENVEALVPPGLLPGVRHALSCSAVGSPERVKARLEALIDRYRPDELILTGQIHDPEARKASFTIGAWALGGLAG